MGLITKSKIKQFLILSTIYITVFSVLTSYAQQDSDSEKITGVKIYQYSGDFKALFDQWEQLGINSVFTSPALDSISSFREQAAKHNIKRFLIIPIFYSPQNLNNNPLLYSITQAGELAKEEWVQFVCPNNLEYRQAKISYIRNLINDLKPDGLSIDFIRYFAFWEKIYSNRSLKSLPNCCFDNTCIDKFQKDFAIEIPSEIKEKGLLAQWILDNHSAEWTQFKCATITSMVKEITQVARSITPSIIVNLHAVPWRENDFDGAVKKIIGQDFTDLQKYVDFISPMCYHHMLKRGPAWIHDVTKQIYEQTNSKILPSIQVGKAYLQNELTAQEFKEALMFALKTPSTGVVFWNWNAIDESPQKRTIIQNILTEKREL